MEVSLYIFILIATDKSERKLVVDCKLLFIVNFVLLIEVIKLAFIYVLWA